MANKVSLPQHTGFTYGICFYRQSKLRKTGNLKSKMAEILGMSCDIINIRMPKTLHYHVVMVSIFSYLAEALAHRQVKERKERRKWREREKPISNYAHDTRDVRSQGEKRERMKLEQQPTGGAYS